MEGLQTKYFTSKSRYLLLLILTMLPLCYTPFLWQSTCDLSEDHRQHREEWYIGTRSLYDEFVVRLSRCLYLCLLEGQLTSSFVITTKKYDCSEYYYLNDDCKPGITTISRNVICYQVIINAIFLHMSTWSLSSHHTLLNLNYGTPIYILNYDRFSCYLAKYYCQYQIEYPGHYKGSNSTEYIVLAAVNDYDDGAIICVCLYIFQNDSIPDGKSCSIMDEGAGYRARPLTESHTMEYCASICFLQIMMYDSDFVLRACGCSGPIQTAGPNSHYYPVWCCTEYRVFGTILYVLYIRCYVYYFELIMNIVLNVGIRHYIGSSYTYILQFVYDCIWRHCSATETGAWCLTRSITENHILEWDGSTYCRIMLLYESLCGACGCLVPVLSIVGSESHNVICYYMENSLVFDILHYYVAMYWYTCKTCINAVSDIFHLNQTLICAYITYWYHMSAINYTCACSVNRIIGHFYPYLWIRTYHVYDCNLKEIALHHCLFTLSIPCSIYVNILSMYFSRFFLDSAFMNLTPRLSGAPNTNTTTASGHTQVERTHFDKVIRWTSHTSSGARGTTYVRYGVMFFLFCFRCTSFARGQYTCVASVLGKYSIQQQTLSVLDSEIRLSTIDFTQLIYIMTWMRCTVYYACYYVLYKNVLCSPVSIPKRT